MKTTDALVKDVLGGNMQSFEVLYNETSKKIYYVCYSFVKNEHDAMDLMQEVYLSALTHLSSLKEPERFTQWISQIAVNKCKDFLTKKVPVLLEEEEMNNILVNDEELSLPEKYIIDREKRKILMNIMLEKLSAIQYQTVVLYYFNGLSQQEIATCMECPEGTVSYRLSVAREKIKAGVLEYEKKSGEKLYCVAGIPFLAAFFAAEADAMVIPNVFAAIMSGFVPSAEASAAAAATEATGAVAVKAAAKTGIKAFFQSAAVKIAAVVLGLAVVGGLGFWISEAVKDGKEAEVKTEKFSKVDEEKNSASENEIDSLEEKTNRESSIVYESENIVIEYVSSTYVPGLDNENGCIQLVLRFNNKKDVSLVNTDDFFCANGLSGNVWGNISRIEPGKQEKTLEIPLFSLKDAGTVEISSVELLLAFYDEGNTSVYSEKALFTVPFSQVITFDAVPHYPYDKCQLVYSDDDLSYYSTLSYKEGENSEFGYVVSKFSEFRNLIYMEDETARYHTAFVFPGGYTTVLPSGLTSEGSPDKLECKGKFQIVDFINGLGFYGAFERNTETFCYEITKEK